MHYVIYRKVYFVHGKGLRNIYTLQSSSISVLKLTVYSTSRQYTFVHVNEELKLFTFEHLQIHKKYLTT